MGNPKDDEMKLSDEKPVEEVIKEAYSEIETRDARIRELEEENSRLKIGSLVAKQNPVLFNSNKRVIVGSTLSFAAFIVVSLFSISYIQSCRSEQRFRDREAAEAAKIPALTPDEVLAYADCDVLDNWDDKQVLLVRKLGEVDYIHIDRLLYKMMEEASSQPWVDCFRAYQLNNYVNRRKENEHWLNRKKPELSPSTPR